MNPLEPTTNPAELADRLTEWANDGGHDGRTTNCGWPGSYLHCSSCAYWHDLMTAAQLLRESQS